MAKEPIRGPLGVRGVTGVRGSRLKRRVVLTMLVIAMALLAIMMLTTAHAGPRDTTNPNCLRSETHAVLQQIENLFGKVRIVSTCRPGARIAGSRHMSHHSNGTAVDFETPNKRAVIRYLRSRGDVFVMTYRDMRHVHFNTGQIGAKFGAWSGRTRYAKRKHRKTYATAIPQHDLNAH